MAGAYTKPLEMVRLAPSAQNAQTWRVRKTENVYYFYADYNPGRSKGEEAIKQVNLSIVLSHFHQTALELGLTGIFICLRRISSFPRTYITRFPGYLNKKEGFFYETL